MIEKTFRLSGAAKCQKAIASVSMQDPLKVLPDFDCEGAHLVQSLHGPTVGFLSARHWVSVEIAKGQRVLHASVNCVSASGRNDETSITVRMVTGEPTEKFEMPPLVGARRYSASIVGEASYQPAIKLCREGEAVEICFELGNPYDDDALVVKSAQGRTIGYLGRTSWLRDALLNDGKGCDAVIDSIAGELSGPLGVVLRVELTYNGIRELSYAPPVKDGS